MQSSNQIPHNQNIPWPSDLASDLQKFQTVNQSTSNTSFAHTTFSYGTGMPQASDVEVDVADVKLLKNGVAVTFIVRSDEDESLWAYFEENKSALESLIIKTISEECGGRLELQKISFQRGSVTIGALIVIANSYLAPYAPIIGTVTGAVGLYSPIKEIVKDIKKLLPTLQKKIKSFFSDFKRRTIRKNRRAIPDNCFTALFTMVKDFLGF